MLELVVADNGPLIALAKLQQLDLLHGSARSVHIPQTVFTEATREAHRRDAQAIAAWVLANADAVQITPDTESHLCRTLRAYLDEGETQAICEAQRLDCPVLMDERLGRKMAQQHGVAVVGLLGVLIQARQTGRITRLAPLLEQLQTANYRISDALRAAALQRVGE